MSTSIATHILATQKCSLGSRQWKAGRQSVVGGKPVFHAWKRSVVGGK